MRLTLVLLLLSDSMTLQLFVYRVAFLLYYIYVGQSEPFLLSKAHKLEMVHLTFLLSHNLLMPIYTDFVLDE